MKELVTFKSKLFKPFRKLSLIFRFKLRRPMFIRGLRFHSRPNSTGKAHKKNRTFTSLHSVFCSYKQSKQMDKLRELKNVSEAEHGRKLVPSPITPAYIRASRTAMKKAFGDEDMEDACRSFENYLVEMIVEEGKVRDLMDVEELLYYWKNLKSPVFIDLVCRFYGELCKDLFSSEHDNDIDSLK